MNAKKENKIIKYRCERCGRMIDEKNPSYGFIENPYAKDLYGDSVEETFCKACYEEAIKDI